MDLPASRAARHRAGNEAPHAPSISVPQPESSIVIGARAMITYTYGTLSGYIITVVENQKHENSVTLYLVLSVCVERVIDTHSLYSSVPNQTLGG